MDMRQYAKARTFLNYDDVADGPMQAKIIGCEVGSYGRPVLSLENGRKISVNRTNTTVLIDAYGADNKDWVGKTAEFYAGTTTFQGETKNSVLIRPVTPPTSFKERTPAAPKEPPKPDDMHDDSIPF